MLKKANLVLKNAEIDECLEGDFFGADQGALQIIKSNHVLTGAIGDFDSVSETEKELIKENCTHYIELNAMKDKSDTQEAIDFLYKMGYTDITVVGGLSKRFDHTWANVQLLRKYSNLTWIDECNCLSILPIGKTNIKKDKYKYVSFFSLAKGKISLRNFKYEIDNYELDELDSLCLSNEILDEYAEVENTMPVLCIKSHD